MYKRELLPVLAASSVEGKSTRSKIVQLSNVQFLIWLEVYTPNVLRKDEKEKNRFKQKL